MKMRILLIGFLLFLLVDLILGLYLFVFSKNKTSSMVPADNAASAPVNPTPLATAASVQVVSDIASVKIQSVDNTLMQSALKDAKYFTPLNVFHFSDKSFTLVTVNHLIIHLTDQADKTKLEGMAFADQKSLAAHQPFAGYTETYDALSQTQNLFVYLSPSVYNKDNMSHLFWLYTLSAIIQNVKPDVYSFQASQIQFKTFLAHHAPSSEFSAFVLTVQ